jgi:hypothetical protein
VDRFLRRLAACLLAVLVLAESSGAARALTDGATVHCCCGEHAAARKCRCSACPVALRGKARHADGDRLAAARECHGEPGDAGVLTVIALQLTAPFALAAPSPIGELSALEIDPLHGRLVDAGRPPP